MDDIERSGAAREIPSAQPAPDHVVCPTAPARIWLQVDPEPDEPGTAVYPANPSRDDVSWCVDQINSNDTLYIRADLAAPAATQPDEEVRGIIEALDLENHRMRRAVAKLMARLTVWLDDDQFNEADGIMHPEFEPTAATQPAEAKLDKPAQVGGVVFRQGVTARLVIEAAQRNYVAEDVNRRKTPEDRVQEEANRRAIWDMIHGAPTQPEGQEAADMDAVAVRYAHKMALDLECILAEYDGKWYDSALQTLGEYRSAMNAIHERTSPTHMGEPVIAARSAQAGDGNAKGGA